MSKIQKKTNIRQIQVKTSARAHHINRLPNTQKENINTNGVSVEQFLKEFKSEKSQARSERSADSQASTNMQRGSNLTYESFTNRYSNNSMVRSIGDGRNIGRQPQFPIHSFKVTVPIKKPYPDSSRSTEKFQKFQKTMQIQSTTGVLHKMLKSLQSFEKGTAESGFEDYIERIAVLNEQVDEVTKVMPNGINKQIFTKFKSVISGLSKRCLIRLYEKEDQLEETADQNRKIASQQALQQLKHCYDKKLSKLMQLLHEKDAKQRQVNRLLYCLRKGGVDIEGIWNKYNKETDSKISAYNPSKKCRTDYE